MQRIFYFELAVALKDRPRSFQFITLLLLSFSIVVILLHSLSQVSGNDEKTKQASRQNNENNFIRTVSSEPTQLLHLKK